MARWQKRFEHCFTRRLSNLFSRHLESTHLEKDHGNIDDHLVPVSLVWSLVLLSNVFVYFVFVCLCSFCIFVCFLFHLLFNLLFGPPISIDGRAYRAPGRVVRSTNKKTKGYLFPTFFRRSKRAKLGQRGELQKNYVEALTVRCKSVPLAFMIS